MVIVLQRPTGHTKINHYRLHSYDQYQQNKNIHFSLKNDEQIYGLLTYLSLKRIQFCARLTRFFRFLPIACKCVSSFCCEHKFFCRNVMYYLSTGFSPFLVFFPVCSKCTLFGLCARFNRRVFMARNFHLSTITNRYIWSKYLWKPFKLSSSFG